MTDMECVRCGADGEVEISTIEGAGPISRLYCAACWRVARYEAGSIMSEGPVTWGQDWPEMEEWLARSLRDIDKRPESDAWRRILAHNLRRQLSHLPPEIPPYIATFLTEFGGAAG
jgi:hypothetical protein